MDPFPTLDDSLQTTGIGGLEFSPVGDLFWGFAGGHEPGTEEVLWVDPTRQTWSAPTQIPGLGSRMASVNSQILVWGMGAETTTSAGTVTLSLQAEVFDPTAGVWSPVACAGAPTWPFIGVTVATPMGLIVFDGAGSPSASGVLEL